ncbi:MAG: NAD-dependent epimerase/dehydratase family protein [Rhizomicrobium sp.]
MQADFLITGGAGFIGCALSAELIREHPGGGPSIVAVDSLHPQVHPQQDRPAAMPEPVQLEVMDACDADSWDRLLRVVRPTTVVHLAAETGTGQSLELPTRHTHVNVTGTAQMLEAFERAGHLPDHIVLASSRAIYGEGQWRDTADGHVFSPGNRSVDQLVRGQFAIIAPSGTEAEPLAHNQAQTPANPASVYGVTKLAQEQILALWCAARGIPLTALRLQNVYGAGQSPHNPYTGIVGLFHRVAAAGLPIEVYEDGLIGRDFIYIDDVARCFAKAVQDPPSRSRVLDVGTGNATTVLESAKTIAAMYNAPDPQISGAFRHGDIRWAVADARPADEAFGIKAQITFEEGSRRLAEWLRTEA